MRESAIGAAEGLVASPLDYPGASSSNDLYNGHRSISGIWIDRDAMHQARQRGEKVDESDFTSEETATPVADSRIGQSQRERLP